MDEHRTVLGTLHHRLEKGRALLIDRDSGREICRRYLQNLPCYFPGKDEEEEEDESAKKKKKKHKN